jgi:hypothetical protein
MEEFGLPGYQWFKGFWYYPEMPGFWGMLIL